MNPDQHWGEFTSSIRQRYRYFQENYAAQISTAAHDSATAIIDEYQRLLWLLPLVEELKRWSPIRALYPFTSLHYLRFSTAPFSDKDQHCSTIWVEALTDKDFRI